jgi:hypothetical protein
VITKLPLSIFAITLFSPSQWFCWPSRCPFAQCFSNKSVCLERNKHPANIFQPFTSYYGTLSKETIHTIFQQRKNAVNLLVTCSLQVAADAIHVQSGKKQVVSRDVAHENPEVTRRIDAVHFEPGTMKLEFEAVDAKLLLVVGANPFRSAP